MLNDREQRVLDATAALIGCEEPELAARLRHHSLGVPRRTRVRRAPPSRRVLGVPIAVWPPLVMVVICLVLVILPPLLL